MKRLLACSLLAALLVSPVEARQKTVASAESNPVFDQIDETMRELSRITGFKVRRRVAHDTIDRDGLKEFLEQRIEKEVKPEEIRIEEMLLKKFGFVPPDFDLKKTTIDLYTEQAAAFYDFRKRRLYLLDSADRALQQAALVHELAHALADQHFRLEKYLDGAGHNDDGALARMAVMEGQATWLMAESYAQATGQSLRSSPELVDLMSMMIAGSTGQFPVFDSVPLYLRESLMFPYVSGMKFQHAVLGALDQKAFGEVFRRPPSTTQQVLHPEKYLSPIKTRPPKVPRLVRERAYRKVAEGTVGEFDYAVLLRQYVSEDAARRLAPAWRAGTYRLLEHKKDKRTVLLQASVWDSPAAAEEFFRLYLTILEGKWDTMELIEEAESRLAGRGDDGYFLLRLSGSHVYSVEGMSDAGEVR